MIIKVVAALIEKDGKYLIARRSTGDSDVFGKWEFPGGKVEDNEDDFQAIEREIKEEFELDVEACEFLVNNVCKYPNKIVDLKCNSTIFFENNIYTGPITSAEFQVSNKIDSNATL